VRHGRNEKFFSGFVLQMEEEEEEEEGKEGGKKYSHRRRRYRAKSRKHYRMTPYPR